MQYFPHVNCGSSLLRGVQVARRLSPTWHRKQVPDTSEYITFIAFYIELLWKKKNTFVRIQNQNTLEAFRICPEDIKKNLRKQIILFC